MNEIIVTRMARHSSPCHGLLEHVVVIPLSLELGSHPRPEAKLTDLEFSEHSNTVR